MFYCEKCEKKNNWPFSMCKSFGTCEMCGANDVACNDVPSSSLPRTAVDAGYAPKKDTATVEIKYPAKPFALPTDEELEKEKNRLELLIAEYKEEIGLLEESIGEYQQKIKVVNEDIEKIQRARAALFPENVTRPEPLKRGPMSPGPIVYKPPNNRSETNPRRGDYGVQM